MCENPLASEEPHCGSCGFPVGLTASAVMAFGRDESESEPEVEAPSAGLAAPVPPPPPPERKALDEFGSSLSGWLDLLRELGMDGRELTGDIRQAALLDAEGRSGEALQLLRAAATSAAEHASGGFQRRAQELEERIQALAGEGLQAQTPESVVGIRAEFADGRPRQAVDRLRQEGRRLEQLESSWHELKSRLRQLDELRGGAKSIGQQYARVEQEMGRVQELLARPRLGPEDIQEALATTAKLVQFFGEALPRQLQQELDQHADRLARYAPDHPPSQKARRLHAEAARHLRHGRIAESALRLSELNIAIAELGELAAAEARHVPGPDEEQLAKLLLQARQLASRVRLLPPGSSAAEEAAGEIREATESLRERRLDDAERALARLLSAVERFESGAV